MKKLEGYSHGVNLGGWMSQCDYSQDRLDYFITEKDFERIAGWGLDHVRLPLDYNVLEREDGSYDNSGFERVGRAVRLAHKYGLNTVVDLHKTAGFSFDAGEGESGFFDNEQYQHRFIRLWQQLAERLAPHRDHVAFELLNEVTDACYIGVWNRVVAECIEAIRLITPDVPVLVGSYWHNSPEAVSELDPPHDEHTYYNFHCYEPLFFTHQGAYWTDRIVREERYSFAESGITEAFFTEKFLPAIQKAEAEGTGLYCGEYGVIDVASPEDTVQWYRVIHNVFEKYGIGHAAWSYKEMDFGLSDERMAPVIDELIRYL